VSPAKTTESIEMLFVVCTHIPCFRWNHVLDWGLDPLREVAILEGRNTWAWPGLPMVYILILNILNVLYKAAGTTRPFASISFLLAFHSVYVPYLMLFPRYSKTLTCTDLNQPIHIRFLVLVLNYFFAFYSKS